jgi:hypothetical protein
MAGYRIDDGWYGWCTYQGDLPMQLQVNPSIASICDPIDSDLDRRFQQFATAKNCSNGCTHFAYPTDGVAAYGGRWLADHAFT